MATATSDIPNNTQGADPIRQDQSAPCHPATRNEHEVHTS